MSTTTPEHTHLHPHAPVAGTEPGHDHGHTHEHMHGHDHEHGPEGGAASGTSAERKPSGIGYGAPVLDIGGDIGAMVLYTAPELEDVEIEVSLTTDDQHRTHTQVHRRTVNGSTFWAGVYAELPEGDYQVFWDDSSVRRSFTITGGAVTELDWRQPAS